MLQLILWQKQCGGGLQKLYWANLYQVSMELESVNLGESDPMKQKQVSQQQVSSQTRRVFSRQ